MRSENSMPTLSLRSGPLILRCGSFVHPCKGESLVDVDAFY